MIDGMLAERQMVIGRRLRIDQLALRSAALLTVPRARTVLFLALCGSNVRR